MCLLDHFFVFIHNGWKTGFIMRRLVPGTTGCKARMQWSFQILCLIGSKFSIQKLQVYLNIKKSKQIRFKLKKSDLNQINPIYLIFLNKSWFFQPCYWVYYVIPHIYLFSKLHIISYDCRECWKNQINKTIRFNKKNPFYFLKSWFFFQPWILVISGILTGLWAMMQHSASRSHSRGFTWYTCTVSMRQSKAASGFPQCNSCTPMLYSNSKCLLSPIVTAGWLARTHQWESMLVNSQPTTIVERAGANWDTLYMFHHTQVDNRNIGTKQSCKLDMTLKRMGTGSGMFLN